MSAIVGRGNWGSRIGFILAAAGSAVGLGNIWKFPYITGEMGGGAFVLVYLACVAVVGTPIMFAEIVIGKLGQRDPVGSLRELAGRDSPWQVVGWAGVLSAFVILSFYSVVAGWAIAFFLRALLGAMAPGSDHEQVAGLFQALYANPFEQVFWHALFMAAVVAIVAGGVRRGIERWSQILMPALGLLLFVLLGYAVTLDGFAEGVAFMFAPRFAQLTPSAVLEAMGHSFFTLSLGMGVMITYGSYLERESNVVRSGLAIVGLDTGIALIAGVAIFAIVFQFGLEPAAGPGLVFQTLPVAFSDLPGGSILAAMFFMLLVFAALTSAISLLEVAVAFFHDELGWDRRLAATGVGSVIFLLGIPSATFGSFLDFMDQISTNYLLPLGGLGIAIYAGWVLDRARAAVALAGVPMPGTMAVWLLLLRYVTPLAVIVVFLSKIGMIELH